jgi:hypothetical protein
VRHMISLSRHATPLLATSKAVRSSQAPCTTLFEKWARDGCPVVTKDENEAYCLESIGGIDAPLCSMLYNVRLYSSNTSQTHDVSAQWVSPRRVASKVLNRFLATPLQGTTNRLFITAGEIVLTLVKHGESENALSLTRKGWMQSGGACRPTNAQVRDFITKLLTRTMGEVNTPCLEGTKAYGRVLAPETLSVRLSVWDESNSERRLLLTAERSD